MERQPTPARNDAAREYYIYQYTTGISGVHVLIPPRAIRRAWGGRKLLEQLIH